MPQQTQKQASDLANFMGLSLTISVIVIVGMIVMGNRDGAFSAAGSTDAGEMAVVQADATATAQPTATLVPPTFTPTFLPTNTSAPTNTPEPTDTVTPTDVPQPTATDTEQAVAAATGGDAANTVYDADLVARGEQQFMLCAACHGPDARGIPNLGKDLVESEFVASQSDDELLTFVKTGRPIWDPLNTTGLDMPSRGGNPALSDDDILAIIAYVRTLSSTADASNGTSTVETVDNASADTSASEDTGYSAELIAQGEQQYLLCAACHGPDARGIPNLGKDLVASEFVASLSDDELLTFVKTGRPIWDPLNTTGLDMPSRGGNPALSDEDILAIIAYIRSLAANDH